MTINAYLACEQNSNSVAQASNATVVSLSGPVTLTAADNGKFIVNRSTANVFTLPDSSTLPPGWSCVVFNQTWGAIGIAATGSDIINTLGGIYGTFQNASPGSYSYSTIRLISPGFFSVGTMNPYDVITANITVDYTTFASGYMQIMQNLPAYSGPMMVLDITAFVDAASSGITVAPQLNVGLKEGAGQQDRGIAPLQTITATGGQTQKLTLANPFSITNISLVNNIYIQGQVNAVATSMTGSISVCMYLGENTFPKIP